MPPTQLSGGNITQDYYSYAVNCRTTKPHWTYLIRRVCEQGNDVDTSCSEDVCSHC